jgi:hypothetical protein
MEPWQVIVQYLLDAALVTVRQLFILTGPGLILGLTMYIISGIISKSTASLLGVKVMVYLTAIGVVIHELGHILFALLFGHQVREFTLFRPDWSSGQLGHVEHAYIRTNLYQVIGNFFIGIGPLLLGAIGIFLSAALLIGGSVFIPLQAATVTASTFGSFTLILAWLEAVGAGGLDVFRLLFGVGHLSRWQLWVFLYLVFAIGSQMKLSVLDLKGAWRGFVVIVGLLLGLNVLTLWAGDYSTALFVSLAGLYGFFHAYMIFAIILNAGIATVLVILATVFGILAQRA